MPTKFYIYIYITRLKKNIILLIYVEVCLRHSLQQNYNTLVFYCFIVL